MTTRGQFAAQGSVCESLLAEWLEHPFISASPPKTTGREGVWQAVCKSGPTGCTSSERGTGGSGCHFDSVHGTNHLPLLSAVSIPTTIPLMKSMSAAAAVIISP